MIAAAPVDDGAEQRVRQAAAFEKASPFDWSVTSSTRRLARRDMTADDPDSVSQCVVCRRLAARVLETALRGAAIDSVALCESVLPKAAHALDAVRDVCDVLVRQLDQQLPAEVLRRRTDGVGRDVAARRAVAAAGGSADDVSSEHVAAALALCHSPLALCRRRDAAPRLVFTGPVNGDHSDGLVHFGGRQASLLVLNELLADDVADGMREREARRVAAGGVGVELVDEYPPVLHVVWLNDPSQPFTAAHFAALRSGIEAFQPARTYVYYDSIPQDPSTGKVNKWFTRATEFVELVRVAPVRAVGDMAVRHVAHAAKFVGLLALRAVGGTLIESDTLLLRDFSPPRNQSSKDFGRDVTLLRLPVSALGRTNVLPRVDLSILRAQRYARWLGRLIEEAGANYNTLAWDAHFGAAASTLAELYPSEVRLVDLRSFDFGVDPVSGAPTDAFWQLLETTGEQLDGFTSVRLRQELVSELGMALPDWDTKPGSRPDPPTTLLCELRPYKGELSELETFWHTARWALRSGRFETATAFLERYLNDAEPALMRTHEHDDGRSVLYGYNRSTSPVTPKVLPSAALASRPDRERGWARLMLAYAYAFRGLTVEAMMHAAEATEHHGRTMREVWFHAARVYRVLAADPSTKRFGLDGERRNALNQMRNVQAEWQIVDCFHDQRSWRRDV